MKILLPDFNGDTEKAIRYLVANKKELVAMKKSAVKEADALSGSYYSFVGKGEDNVIKGVLPNGVDEEAKVIKARLIINTTKLLDSHGDVHLDQLWNKTLKEGEKYHIQEHQFNYAGMISKETKAFAKQMSWADLGINFKGNTQALVIDSTMRQKDKWPLGTDMFKEYLNGNVDQHSVGMQYITIDLAVNDNRYEKEFANWEKWFPEVANKEDALNQGWFWGVTEAKFREGSAVLAGSNWATPTQSIQQVKGQPLQDTDEPEKSTLKASELIKFYNSKMKL